MSELGQSALFYNIAPFVTEIIWALVVVFAVSFAAGWMCARKAPDESRRGKD